MPDTSIAFARLPGGCAVVDDAARVAIANDEARRLLGHTGDTLVGVAVASLIAPAMRFFVQTYVCTELALRGRVDEVYVTLVDKSGARVPVVVSAVRETSASGYRDVVVFLPVHRQLIGESEVHRASARASSAEAQLAVAERMATMGTLTASVAHEINNPLTYAVSNVELLEGALARGETLGAEERAMLRDVHEGLVRIRDIVSGLRSLTRVDASRRVPVDLVAVIEQALRISGAELRQRARVETHLPSTPLRVLGDEGRLSQVLVNLLVNATQALRGSPGSHVVQVALAREGADAVLDVIDDGPGIPAEIQARIFEPFYTTKPVGEGTGLGLAVCREIIGSLGGTIEVASAPGEGTRFRVRIPAVNDAVLAPSAAVTPSASSSPPRGRVLLVEDDAQVARVVGRVLSGCDVTWCADASSALARIEAAPEPPFDAVLCDLALPHTTGMELHAVIADRWPSLAPRIVFLSGGAFTEAARAFVTTMQGRVIAKPFRPESLRSAVAAAMRVASAVPPAPS
jgi:PAS domain S-box-containing protein